MPAVARDRASRALTGVLPTRQVHVYPVTIEIHPREGERRRPGQLLLRRRRFPRGVDRGLDLSLWVYFRTSPLWPRSRSTG